MPRDIVLHRVKLARINNLLVLSWFAWKPQGTSVHMQILTAPTLQSIRLLRLKCTAMMPLHGKAVHNGR